MNPVGTVARMLGDESYLTCFPGRVYLWAHTSRIEVIDKRDEVVKHCVRKI